MKELVKGGVEAGVTAALALTNINSTCDAWDFVQYCRDEGIKPILGVEIRNSNKLLYTPVIAANNRWLWQNQCLSCRSICWRKRSFRRWRGGSSGAGGAGVAGMFERAEDGFVIYPFGVREPGDLLENERIGVLPEVAGKLLRVSPERPSGEMGYPSAGDVSK